MKESKQITLGSSESTSSTATDFTYSMRAKVISIRYSGSGSITKRLSEILRKIEYWHQGSITSYRILYQDAAGLGGEVRWDGNQAQPKYPATSAVLNDVRIVFARLIASNAKTLRWALAVDSYWSSLFICVVVTIE
jgi:hypothetical protein